jgi:hypothetical protein
VRSPASVLEPEFASKAVELSLRCVEQDSPHYDEGQGFAPHAEKIRHPAFFGCFDWHSAVHGHWAMLRTADTLPDLPETSAIIQTLSKHLTRENLEAELRFLNSHPSFERPYGWGWGLRLGQELRLSKLPEAKRWLEDYSAFENHLEDAMKTYLSELRTPNRVGMHDNTAFAMIHSWDYATTAGKLEFREYLAKRARDLFLMDKDCSLANEPGPTDFLSPCFVEADLMRRVLSQSEFREWYAHFLPNVRPEQLKPVPPTDLHNPFQVHLVGLMYEKSSAMIGVANMLDPGDSRKAILLDAVNDQIKMAGKLMFESDYGGTHWLATFAIYFYSNVGL